MDNEQNKKKSSFAPNLWGSLGLMRRELNCERAYYNQHVNSEDRRSVVYQFHSGKKPNALLPAASSQRQPPVISRTMSERVQIERARRKPSIFSGYESDDLDTSEDRHPFTTSLKHGLLLHTKEAVCLLGLKKRIARLYEESMAEASSGSKRSRNGASIEETPVKRKRGRPPKNKSSFQPDTRVDGNDTKRMIRCSRSRTTRDDVTPSKSTIVESKRKGRLCSRSRPRDNSPSGPKVEKEIVSSVLYRSASCRQQTDEELALQLHLDLNAPSLRRRSRSTTQSSPSNREQ